MSKNKQTNKKKPQPQPDGKKYFQNSIHNVIREEVQHYKLSLRVKTLNRSKPSAETDTRNPRGTQRLRAEPFRKNVRLKEAPDSRD